MSKDVIESKGTEVGTNVDLGVADDLTVQDCDLGMLVILQSNSDIVKQEEGKQGTIINTADPSTVLGTKESPLEFIVLTKMTYWTVTDEDTMEFLEKFPGTHENEHKWKQQKNGRNLNYTYNIAYLVLLCSEIKDGFALPMQLTFRSTSLKTAKAMNRQFLMMGKKGEPSWSQVYSLGVGMNSKGKNSWYVPIVKPTRKAEEPELAAAQEYRKMLTSLKEKAMEVRENSEVESEEVSGDAPQRF